MGGRLLFFYQAVKYGWAVIRPQPKNPPFNGQKSLDACLGDDVLMDGGAT
jgi:hypothetical protein